MPVPKYDELINPLLQAMNQLGGSASVSEQEDAVASILKLSEKEIAEIHRGSTTKLSYRLAWARNYMKRFGLLENSARGVWTLTLEGRKKYPVNTEEVKRAVRNQDKAERKLKVEQVEFEIEPERDNWQDELLSVVKEMPADSFERLCQLLLRESGFIQVEVTGKSGDGGIDGKGVMRIGGLLSFHVIFQCKRYKGSVSASIVRDFRGAMVGRADKGLLISTGTFTRDARIEAQRDGAPPIDLIDGDELVQKLKELGIGVEVKQKVVEEIKVQKDYFASI
jgi:restriction system protein